MALAFSMFAAGAVASAMRTDRTERRLAELIFVCYHTKVSEWECPDTGPDTAAGRSSEVAKQQKRQSRSRRSTAPIYDDQLKSILLTLTTSTNRTIVREVPANVDAIFLTKASTRNFLLRYYRDAKAVEKAERLEARLGRTP